MKIFKSLFLLLILACTSLLIYENIYNTPKRIFNNTLNSVVELRSTYEDDSYAYGSAVFIEEDILVSNAHTVSYKKNGVYIEFTLIEIRFAYEVDFRKVEVLKFDNDLDISILKLIDVESLDNKPISISNSENIKSGDTVYAIGNALNHGVSITQGIVSLPRVNIIYDELQRNVIRCDLTINEGNSGGALVNKYGKLIGITTFRLKDSSGVVIQGIAFCIPIEEVLEFYKLSI